MIDLHLAPKLRINSFVNWLKFRLGQNAANSAPTDSHYRVTTITSLVRRSALALGISAPVFITVGFDPSAPGSAFAQSTTAQCTGLDGWLTDASDRYLKVTVPSDTNMARWHSPPRTASLLSPVDIRSEANEINAAAAEQAQSHPPTIGLIANRLILQTVETTSLALATLADEIELGNQTGVAEALLADAKATYAELQLEIHMLRQTCDLRLNYGFVEMWCFPEPDQQWLDRSQFRFGESYTLLQDAVNSSVDEVDRPAFGSARDRILQLRMEQSADSPSPQFAPIHSSYLEWYNEITRLLDDGLDGTPNEISNDADPLAPLIALHSAEVELDLYCDRALYETFVSAELP